MRYIRVIRERKNDTFNMCIPSLERSVLFFLITILKALLSKSIVEVFYMHSPPTFSMMDYLNYFVDGGGGKIER